jgi:hypothetical protein
MPVPPKRKKYYTEEVLLPFNIIFEFASINSHTCKPFLK